MSSGATVSAVDTSAVSETVPGMNFDVIGRGEVRPELSKMDAVKNFKVPTMKQEVHAFLGITGYY